MLQDQDSAAAAPAQPAWLLPALVGVLVLGAGLIAFLLTGGLSSPTSAVAPTAVPAVAPAAAEPADLSLTHGGLNPDGPPVSDITLTQARTHFDAATAIFIDMRAGSDFAAGHIPGALTITSPELEQRLSSLPPGAVVIAYGDATRPDSGRRGAQIFMELGYPQVLALEGGFQAWQNAGHPVNLQ